jgi:hypothetical protein
VQEICYHLTMRRVRITYPGAYHHVMNRGYDGNPIFAGNVTKSHFLDYLEGAVTEMKMRIFAYCITALWTIIITWLNLKEGAGLSYKEIAGIEIFKNLKFSTLRSMYRNMKQKRSR